LTNAKPFLSYKHFPDTLIVTGRPDLSSVGGDVSPLKPWLVQRSSQVRRICSVCTGVFCLAQAGLLDGRRLTTHWQYAAELAQRFPTIQVDPEPVFLRDGNVFTSAGCTAAMDMALALIEYDVARPWLLRSHAR
jgi:transcriptional regulator GlxA family with amidase domain